ncbi:hypothetical protein H310_12140 [Aphanomyces invadans]|uniref:Divalent metal cation transporter MntH n=1 Tax=Aphanomyces invadans TaxID=157072 RepID=A0A024TL99_9STRA|nr:hypothetical protein H310_12140 [Aphanomyces invadans]ETV94137.1 hypothetical protein H310_12140 [Aphanomyces invadans]RHY30144.1 hypothetical protein DYB32_004619 [Aphanomyces invadans]|eukprot:XP_008877340.1 hypothetical protein H310_12140 [Aphanomyces invadans]
MVPTAATAQTETSPLTPPGSIPDSQDVPYTKVDSSHAIDIPASPPTLMQKILPALGSAFVASVAYLDPGNFATNIQAGSNYSFTLLWVILLANVMAMLFQTLSAKLGIATGKNLPEVIADQFPQWVVWVMWIAAEVAAIATDVAEFIGAAIAFKLLFSISLAWGAVITAGMTLVLLYVHQHRIQAFEVVIFMLVSVIVVSYIMETALQPSIPWADVAYHTFVPGFEGKESLVLAVGIVGATVMPHVIYLHSALTQSRFVVSDDGDVMFPPLRYEVVGIVIALGIAGLVNMSMLIMAAATFNTSGYTDVDSIENAYRTLEPLLGKAASYVFAIGLLASGISSSAVGTLAGQVIMAGFLNFHVNVWIRRAVTLVPSMLIIVSGADPTQALVFSQVVLSFCIPFALVPLALFAGREDIMGKWKSSWFVQLITAALCTFIVGLNVYLVLASVFDW